MSLRSINCAGRLLTFDSCKVMGILNCTPDSFYDGGRYSETDKILAKIEKMVAEGVDIIDVGGQSTKPGSLDISPELELNRVLPAIELISKRFPEVFISIDTYKSKVAQEAILHGAHMVNDISASRLDSEILAVVAQHKVPYIAMHSKGTPENMQSLAQYENITVEVAQYFAQKLIEYKQHGIHDVILDPGFGFAKNLEQNYQLLQNINYLQELKRPLLIGVSRKSMIFKALQINPDEALNGTSVLHTWAVLHGAHILRVHDVKEAKECIKLVSLLKNQ